MVVHYPSLQSAISLGPSIPRPTSLPMSDTLQVVPEAAAPAPEPHAGSFPRRVLDTFFSPVALFQRFGARPPWLDVTILSIVLGLAMFTLVPHEVWVNTMEKAMAANPRQAQGMDVDSMIRIQRIGGRVMAPVMTFVFLAAFAGLMVLIYSVVMGGRATFRQYLGVAAHTMLVGAAGQLITLPLIIQKGVMMQGISLGALAGGMDPESFVYQFLNAMNVFLIWQTVLLGVGAAALNRRMSYGAAVGVALGIYAVIAAAIAMIF